MHHRRLVNGLGSTLAARIVYPITERLTGRDIDSKRRALALEMAKPFTERRQRSWAALVELVRFAGRQVPYYRDLFARLRFDPEKLTRDRRYFDDIPYLTKDLIQSEDDRLLRTDHASFRKHVSKTGGSTGASVRITYDQDAADWSSAVTRYARSTVTGAGSAEAGFPSELHFATKFPDAYPLIDRLREHVKCLAMNRTNIFFTSLDPVELAAMWRKIKSVRPHLVHAHPTTIFHLALFVEASGDDDKAFEIFEASGELLEPKQRETIARALRCAVVDRYGLAEAGVVAYQTDVRDTAMLVFDPFCWPEIAEIEDNQDYGFTSVKGASRGELVITALRNRMMPLIRYRTGDVAVMGETARGFLIHQMVGRMHDVFRLAGRTMPTHCLQDILNRVGGIRRFQVEVTREGPILRIVPEPDADLTSLRTRLAGWWEGKMKIEFVEMSGLKLQGSRSKFRHVVDFTGTMAPAEAVMESTT
jgi:phenylacetate-CoA ligase